MAAIGGLNAMRITKLAIFGRWSGVFSIAWLLAGWGLFLLGVWLFPLMNAFGVAVYWGYIALGWWNPALLLAAFGLLRGNVVSRICAVLVIAAVAFVIWGNLTPRHNPY